MLAGLEEQAASLAAACPSIISIIARTGLPFVLPFLGGAHHGGRDLGHGAGAVGLHGLHIQQLPVRHLAVGKHVSDCVMYLLQHESGDLQSCATLQHGISAGVSTGRGLPLLHARLHSACPHLSEPVRRSTGPDSAHLFPMQPWHCSTLSKDVQCRC